MQQKAPSKRASCSFPLPCDNTPYQSTQSKLTAFWNRWEDMAMKRKELLPKKRITKVDWRTLDANYQQTNSMLSDCPVPRFARAARLAKIDASRSLLSPPCAAYALLGKFPTYVGQVGARAKLRKRPFMARLVGHFQKAKALKAAYHHNKVRKRRAKRFFGTTPSLPRLLAMHGTHQVTMRPMEDAPPHKLDSVEHRIEKMLSPCCNAVPPYAGTQRVDWLLAGAFNIETVGNLKQLASEILTCKRLHQKYSVPQLLTILLECKRPMKPVMFRALFLKIHKHLLNKYNIYLPERIPVRVPIPDKHFLLAVRSEFARMLAQSRLPAPLTAWLIASLSCMPQRTPKVHQAIRGARTHIATGAVAEQLQREAGTTVSLNGLTLGTLIQKTPHVIRKEVRRIELPLDAICQCTQLSQNHHIPKGQNQQHIVLRSTEQWASFHTEPSLLTQNARNSTLPSELHLTKSLCVFETSITPILHTRHPESDSKPEHADNQCAAISTEITQRARAFIESHSMQYPCTAAENLHTAHTKLKAWNLVATPWDKKLHKLGGFCTVLCETHVQKGILSAKEFDIVGVGPSHWQCQAMALSLILQSAHRHRILKLGEDLNVLHSALQDPQYRTVYISRHCIPETLWDVLPFPDLLTLTAPKRRSAPPTIFALPKWKLQEMINFFLWRNIISFANHPIKPLATKVGRCLTLMIREVNSLYPYMSTLM